MKFKHANEFFFNLLTWNITDKTENFDANIPVQLFVQEISIAMSAEPTLAC